MSMFKKSSLGSRKSFPGGRRDGGAFQELRHLTAEEEVQKPHAVDKPVNDTLAVHEAVHGAAEGMFNAGVAACTCPPEPEHDHDVAVAEGEGMPPLKNNCKTCFPTSHKEPEYTREDFLKEALGEDFEKTDVMA